MENRTSIRILEGSNLKHKPEVVCERVPLLKGPDKIVSQEASVPSGSNTQPTEEELIKNIAQDITNTRRQLGELHRKLLPTERQLLMKKEQTALEVSKYFSDLKLKVNQYLLEQEEKIQKELSLLTEKESEQLNQDVSQCCNLLDSLDEKETRLKSAKSVGSENNQLSANDLNQMQISISEYADSCSKLQAYANEPFEIRFMINTDLEDMFTNCNIVTIETISARHTFSRRSERSRDDSITSADNEIAYADNASGDNDSELTESESSESVSESDDDSLSEDEDANEGVNTGNTSTTQNPAQTRDNAGGVDIDARPTNLLRATSEPSARLASAVDDEPPPPYPGPPQGYTPLHSNLSVHSTSRVQIPDVVVYPPQFGVEAPQADQGRSRIRQRSTEPSSTPLQTPPHSSTRSGSSNCRQYPGSGATSHSTHRRTASSSSLPENENTADVIKTKNGSNALYPNVNEENIHPELRVPNSAYPSPSAPPLPEGMAGSAPSFVRPRRSTEEARNEDRLPGDARNSSERVPASRYRRPTSAPVEHGTESERPRRRKHHSAPFSFKFILRVNTAIAADERPPGLVGIASLADAYLIVVDRWNCKLKLIKNREVKSVLLFGTFEPWDVATVSDTKCAVTVPKASEICFVSRQGTKLKLEKRVSTARGYACIAYSRHDNCFVCGCCPQFGRPHVAIISLEGEVIKLIRENASKVEMFSYPRGIAVTEDDTLVVADNNKNSVIFLRMNGSFLSEYRGHRSGLLQDAQAVTALQYQRLILVADSKTNSVHVLTNTGAFKGVIPGGSDISNPRRLAVTAIHQPQLLVAHGNGYVSVFDIAWNV